MSGQTQRGYSEELPDDNADFTDRGAPLKQYDPKLMCARSRFEGERTPRNEWNRRVRTKPSLEHQGQVYPNVTEAYVPIMHMMLGKMVQEKNRANLQRFRELTL